LALGLKTRSGDPGPSPQKKCGLHEELIWHLSTDNNHCIVSFGYRQPRSDKPPAYL
jgi:hypothetical protein